MYLLPLIPRISETSVSTVTGSVPLFVHTSRCMSVRPPAPLHVCYCHTPVRYASVPPESGDRGTWRRRVGSRSRPHFRRIDLRPLRTPTVLSPGLRPPCRSEFGASRPRLGRHLSPGRRRAIHADCRRANGVPVGAATGAAQAAGGRGRGISRSSLPADDGRCGDARALTASCVARERPAAPVATPCRAGASLRAGRGVHPHRRGRLRYQHGGGACRGYSGNRSQPGSARDIVRPDVDGLLLETPDVASLRAAVETMARRHWDREALAGRARDFSRDRFLDRFRTHLTTLGVP